jgi:hypothetical protein
LRAAELAASGYRLARQRSALVEPERVRARSIIQITIQITCPFLIHVPF